MISEPIMSIKPLGFPWETSDPFLFCAYHRDEYPKGNLNMEPDASLDGRNIGQDFEIKDGWRMYHGNQIPGFPSHPHRGFETISIVQEGLVDHADSLGAAGRYGNGDVQWMTTGKGVQHSEMFPLLKDAEENPLLMFQIWLNLPKKSKLVEPHYAMLWGEDIPIVTLKDENENETEVTVVAGKFRDQHPLAPAPDSWAANPTNEVAIWTIKMEPNAKWVLPLASAEANRSLYYFKGKDIKIGEESISINHTFSLKANEEVIIENGSESSYFLFLQGRPIGEPVVQYGPFVMNTEDEIRETMREYQKTQFGGWPWSKNDQVHLREKGRFARQADGTIEEK
ncbi:MAG: pirin family protein [Cytophagales bacterium]|nr:pirin family protein [Cytophagales bacterium]